jgi:iron(III) transport system permease protein
LNANSFPVLVLVVALSIVPYAYGVIFGAVKQLDAGLQEAAAVCGASRFRALRSIVLPVLRPAILAGALLSGVVAASEVSYPLVLSPGTGITVLPVIIYEHVILQGNIGPARAMSTLLTVLTVVGMLIYARAVARGSFVTVGGRGLRVPRAPLGRWRFLATFTVLLFLTLALVLPLVTVVYLSLVNLWTAAVFREPLSLIHYRIVLADHQNLLGLINSSWLAITSATLVVAFGFLVAFARVRRPGAVSRVISVVTTLPLGIPSVALGFAVLDSFSGYPLPLYGTPLILIVGYVIHALPFGVRNSEASLLQIGAELEEAAAVSGDSMLGTFYRITIPLVRAPILAAWALAFIILFRDFAISVFVYTPETVVSAVSLWNIYENASIPTTCAYAAIMAAVSAAVVFLALLFSRRAGFESPRIVA